jgi:hypothetical protein
LGKDIELPCCRAVGQRKKQEVARFERRKRGEMKPGPPSEVWVRMMDLATGKVLGSYLHNIHRGMAKQ